MSQLSLPINEKRIVMVPFSGGVSSAWCAGWALRTFPREEVWLVWHDTKEEDPDTYRFLFEMADRLGLPVNEWSDGRSVEQVFIDEGFLGNNQNAECSRILKRIPGDAFVAAAVSCGYDVVKIVGFSASEPRRVQHAVGRAANGGYSVRFPLIETGTSKQDAVDWCLSLGVKPSSMYCWSEHANCVGCVKGGMAYWMAVHKNRPDVYWRRAALEENFGHGILRGGDREHHLLKDLVNIRLKRAVNPREKITIGACDCGD